MKLPVLLAVMLSTSMLINASPVDAACRAGLYPSNKGQDEGLLVTEDNAYVGDYWNDKLTHIEVMQGSVTVFEHAGYKGASASWGETSGRRQLQSWVAGKVSSVKCN